MDYNLVVILSFSIAIAGIIGLVRFRKIDSSYYFFLFFIWLGLLNEVVSFILIKNGHSNAINSNIYVLLEAALLLFFFQKQGLFRKHRTLFILLLVSFTVIWVAENFYLSSIKKFCSYFIAFYSFVVVLLSINFVNSILPRERKLILRNASFLICVGLISFYTSKVVIEIFWIYGLDSSREFRLQVYRIMTFVNLIVNLIFAVAVLWIPKNQEYTLP